ncbi:MAG: hypothetical protein HYV26_18455 [Candidatus Hydrogenedentes bacterium]|nr:hypothetical protein [Candidatus Hydrogenedentota bacterium]
MAIRGSPTYFVALVALLALPALALDVALTYQTAGVDREFFPYGGNRVELTLDAPPGAWKLPELVSQTPVYGLPELGDRKHLVLLDRKAKSDKFFTRLYFDKNANSDLTDDPVIDGRYLEDQQRPEYLNADFDPVDMTVVAGGAELPYQFTPNLYCFKVDGNKEVTEEPNRQNLHLYFSTRCAYSGTLALDGASYAIWLGDRDGNARFNDSFSIRELERPSDRVYAQGDSFYLVKSDEKLSHEYGQTLGRYLVVGDKVFEVAIDIAARKLTLTPVTESLATLSWPADLAGLEVYAEDKTAVMFYHPGGKAPLPAGTYRLLSYRLYTNDEQGDRWQLVAAGTKKGTPITAEAGNTVKLALGEPYRPVVQIPDYARDMLNSGMDQVQLSLEVRGAGEEVLGDLRRIAGQGTKIALSSKDNQRPAEPTYKIVDTEGEVVSSGRFEYG